MSPPSSSKPGTPRSASKSAPAKKTSRTASAKASPKATTKTATQVARKPVKQMVDGRLVKSASKPARPPRATRLPDMDDAAPRKRVTRKNTPALRANAPAATALPVAETTVRKRKAPAASAPAAASDGLPKRKRAKTLGLVEVLKKAVLDALDEMKAREVVALDVREKTSITDWFVIAGGTSSRHVKSLADEVVKAAKLLNLPPLGVEGEREGEWIVVDLGDIVVHVMQPRAREFYALEKLWGVGGDTAHDAPLE